MYEAGDDVREALKMEKLDAVVTYRGLNAGMDHRGPTTAFVTEPKIFGRDAVKERIVETLSKARRGVGKTTLAQLVYNDARVQGCFCKRIWVSVSADFDEVRLTREIRDCVSTGVSKHEGIKNLNKLQEILDEDLKSKRLLLVLDDMWEDNDKSRWNKLLAPLRSSMNGNVILVTTRNHSMVKMISTVDPIHLDGLKDDGFWLMFKSCAFGDEKYEGHPSLQVIGQWIANKLKGYPLAAKSVGALLKRDLDGGLWMSVLQSDEWKLQQGPDDIIPALKLSYIHMPFHLQRCLSYCSLFPKGNGFDRLDLVLDVEYWVDLSTLPHGMNNLLNLRHFVARAELHAKIAGVGRLKFLQELKEFRVGKTKDFQIKQLKGLRELGGSLAIYNLENVGSREESWNAGLRDKIYMHDLLLSWCKNRFDVSSVTEAHVLEGLHPHSALKRLHITSYGETFIVEKCARLSGLDGVGSLCSIKHMRIFECPSLAIPCGPSSPDEQNKDLRRM
nr:putative disease resistance protein RGA3 [Aegilops tauschii subsp. strangulata]